MSAHLGILSFWRNHRIHNMAISILPWEQQSACVFGKGIYIKHVEFSSICSSKLTPSGKMCGGKKKHHFSGSSFLPPPNPYPVPIFHLIGLGKKLPSSPINVNTWKLVETRVKSSTCHQNSSREGGEGTFEENHMNLK